MDINIKRTHSQIENNRETNIINPVQIGEGQATVPIETFLHTPDTTINSREITVEYVSLFNDIMSSYIRCYYMGVKDFIKRKINQNYIFDTNETMMFSQILNKIGELNAYILSQTEEITFQFKRFMKVDFKVLLNNCDLEMSRNVVFSGSTYTEFFMKYYEFSDKRYKISQINLDSINDKRNIGKLESIIDKSIKDLKILMDKKYYSLFRMLFSPCVTIYEKAKVFLKYIGERNDLPDNKLHQDFISDYTFSKISTNACYTVRLQIFIDLLLRVKSHPKTLANLDILMKECQDCFQYFQEDVPHYREWQKMKPDQEIPLIVDYYDIKNYLRNLRDELTKLHGIESKKAKKAKSNMQRPAIKKNLAPMVPKDVQDDRKESIVALVEENKDVKEQSSAPDLWKETIIEDEADNFGDIEKEVSDLFESIRQLFESDRRKKIELKEARVTEKFKRKEEKPLVIETNVAPPVIKLSSHNRLTLEALFGEENVDRKISHNDVQCLVEILRGYVKGKDGSKFNIYWGEKGKYKVKAGGYEIIHGQDGKDLLKAGWANKVREAIEVGINIGYISKDILPVR